jgi:hypothetical protein
MGALAACALPPRETDRSTPEGTFRTFRGAAARGEFEREWDCLSDPLRRSFGIESRADWKDARAIILTQDHLAIRALKRAKITGDPIDLPDGRIQLPVAVHAVFFRIDGTVTLRRSAVLRAWLPGESEPRLDERLDSVRLAVATQGLGLEVPSDLLEWLLEGEDGLMPGMEFDRFEAAQIWFLDEFSFGDQTSRSVQQDIEAERETQRKGDTDT